MTDAEDARTRAASAMCDFALWKGHKAASRSPRPGPPVGPRASAGTSSAHDVHEIPGCGSTSQRRPDLRFRTTRTSWRSRPRPGTLRAHLDAHQDAQRGEDKMSKSLGSSVEPTTSSSSTAAVIRYPSRPPTTARSSSSRPGCRGTLRHTTASPRSSPRPQVLGADARPSRARSAAHGPHRGRAPGLRDRDGRGPRGPRALSVVFPVRGGPASAGEKGRRPRRTTGALAHRVVAQVDSCSTSWGQPRGPGVGAQATSLDDGGARAGSGRRHWTRSSTTSPSSG